MPRRLSQTLPQILSLAVLFAFVRSVAGNEAAVVSGGIRAFGENRYAIYASVLHHDEGWEHYANKWEVVGDDGVVYGSKVLRHPHVNEQPVSRGLFDVYLPPSLRSVSLRAYDSVHGLGEQVFTLEIPR